MGHVSILLDKMGLDKMGLDKMGLDEMGINQYNHKSTRDDLKQLTPKRTLLWYQYKMTLSCKNIITGIATLINPQDKLTESAYSGLAVSHIQDFDLKDKCVYWLLIPQQ